MNDWFSRSSVLGAPENRWHKANVCLACVWLDDHLGFVFVLEVLCEDRKKKEACIMRDFRN